MCAIIVNYEFLQLHPILEDLGIQGCKFQSQGKFSYSSCIHLIFCKLLAVNKLHQMLSILCLVYQ